MTVLKTKQFNGIQFGSVCPDFFDYNYIGDTTKNTHNKKKRCDENIN